MKRRGKYKKKPVVCSTPISCTKRSPFFPISSFFPVFTSRVVQTHLDNQLDLRYVTVACTVLVTVVRHSLIMSFLFRRIALFLVLRSSLSNRIGTSLLQRLTATERDGSSRNTDAARASPRSRQ